MNPTVIQRVAETLAQNESVAQALAGLDASSAAAAAESVPFLAAMVDAAQLVARADGSLTDEESGLIAAAVAGMVGEPVTDALVGELLAEASGSDDLDGSFDDLVRHIGEDVALREATHLVACAVAWKGGIGERQGLALLSLARALGFSQSEHQKLLGLAVG